MNPSQLARSMTIDEIKQRIDRINYNLANPAPACRGNRASWSSAKRDARHALGKYKAALRLLRGSSVIFPQ